MTAPDARRKAEEALAAHDALPDDAGILTVFDVTSECLDALRALLAEPAPAEPEPVSIPYPLPLAVREAAEKYRADLDFEHHHDRQDDSGICTDRSHKSGERLLSALSREYAAMVAVWEATERLREASRGDGQSFYLAAMNLLDEIDALSAAQAGAKRGGAE